MQEAVQRRVRSESALQAAISCPTSFPGIPSSSAPDQEQPKPIREKDVTARQILDHESLEPTAMTANKIIPEAKPITHALFQESEEESNTCKFEADCLQDDTDERGDNKRGTEFQHLRVRWI